MLRQSRSEARRPAPDSDLPRPRDFTAAYGRDVDRGLCLGGGGLFFVAWQAAYLQTLGRRGIGVGDAERVVGTSAGSMVAAALTAGRLKRLYAEVSFLSRVPALFSTMAPASSLHPSQQRALDLFLKATDAEASTVQEIGHAALAAATPSPAVTRRNVALVVGSGRWPSDALHITCVDAYTGERCVIAEGAGVSVRRAVAASSAVPGVFAPQPVGDRRCMDGGVGGSGVHLDLLVGARRALVLALTDGSTMSEGMMTVSPEAARRELEELEASGTEVVVRVPAQVDLMMLMEPAAVPDALSLGARQAAQDADDLSAFWR